MSETVQFLLWFIGIPVLVIAAIVAAMTIELAGWQLQRATTRSLHRFAALRDQATDNSARERDRQAFLQWLAARAKTDVASGMVDEQLVQAQEQGELIKFLVEDEVPQAVMRCVETHRLTAQVTGALHLSEIAYEPECYYLRANVAWLLAHTVELLQAYPLRLNDARLLHNSIVLRKRALPTCRHCPYIHLSVGQAPKLCPTAQLIQVQPPPNPL